MSLTLNGTTNIVQGNIGSNVAGTGPAFGATDTSTTSTAGVATLISFDTEVFDTASAWDGSKFLPLVAGYYQINASVNNGTNTNAGSIGVYIYQNGATINSATTYYAATWGARASVSGIVYLNGSTDYIQIYGLNANNANLGVAAVSGALVRAA